MGNVTLSQCSSPVILSAATFSTYPDPTVADNPVVWYFDQILGTGLLLFLINALTDANSPNRTSPAMTPVLIGVLVMVIGQTMGVNCAYAINPARDLGPRFYTYLAGWKNVFNCRPYYWLCPVVGPIVGAILGTGIYRFCLGREKYSPTGLEEDTLFVESKT